MSYLCGQKNKEKSKNTKQRKQIGMFFSLKVFVKYLSSKNTPRKKTDKNWKKKAEWENLFVVFIKKHFQGWKTKQMRPENQLTRIMVGGISISFLRIPDDLSRQSSN